METLRFQSKIVDSEKANKGLTKVKIHAAYEGLNRNNSFISKETFDKASSSAQFKPIVGEWSEEAKDFQGHGGKTEIKNGEVKFIKTTIPYGVISNEDSTWETVELPDGTSRKYFTVTGYLWTERYPELQSIVDSQKSHSMEVKINQGEFQNLSNQKVYVIEDMSFSAFCILGDSTEPCFESSAITAYSLDKDEFKKEFNQMLEELKFSLGDSNMDYDKKEHIKINNTKDAANMTGSWSSVDKTALRNKLVDASNAKALVEEGYLIVDKDWKHAPSEALHYPHHEIKGDTLVVHKAGLEAAYSRLMQNDPHNEKALAHVKRHYRELGLDMSSFEIEGGNKMNEKELELAKKELEQVKKDFEAEKEKAEKFEADFKTSQERITELEKELGESQVKFNKVEEENKELKEFKLNIEKEVKEKAVAEVFESVKGNLSEDELAPYKEKAMDMDVEALKTAVFAHIGRKAFESHKDENTQVNFQMNIHEHKRDEIKSGKGYEHIIEKYKK